MRFRMVVTHDPLSSAMHFAGNDMSKHRITNLWSQSDGKPFILATLRKKWVDYLNSNILPPSPLSSSQKSGLFRWSTTTRFTVSQLRQHWPCSIAQRPLIVFLLRILFSVLCCARGAPHGSSYSTADHCVVHARLSRW